MTAFAILAMLRMLVPDLNVNVFRINRTSLKNPLMQFLCFFLSQKKRLQDTCELSIAFNQFEQYAKNYRNNDQIWSESDQKGLLHQNCQKSYFPVVIHHNFRANYGLESRKLGVVGLDALQAGCLPGQVVS